MKKHLITLFMCLLSLLVCLPVIMVVCGSIKDSDELESLLLPLFTDG